MTMLAIKILAVATGAAVVMAIFGDDIERFFR